MEVLLILFVATVLVLQVKKVFHWKYLKEVRADLKKYESHADFKDGADLSNPTEFWDQFGISLILLLPFFWPENSDTVNEESKKYVKIVFYNVAVVYILIGLTIWRIIESGITITFDG
ncbi:hypothetical protein TH63_06295 [Rufibacter radiotolerans]|uniref:Uncharacterized protein n=1 Tax=Rufibacter radiotolerans TaxID=1379910 RepID=A0A0H4VNL9_9BACT|nr:hypothetical protein [Rufibacter radiotolerans]AKQ45334.1 hypothetical protein TH63_06295 [Rufibacter radiotolerans]